MKPKYFFWIIFTITLYFMLNLYKPFMMNIIIALLLCVSTFGLKRYIDRFIKYNFLSSFITLGVFMAFFIIPLIFVGYELVKEIVSINTTQLTHFVGEMKTQILNLIHKFPSAMQENAINTIKSFDTSKITAYIINFSTSVGKISINFLTDLTFIIIFLYLFYYYGAYLREYILSTIPFKRNDSEEIIQEVSGVVEVVFFTTIISMILQGISFGVVASIFGFSGILFGVLYGIASIVPVVGGALVWVPISLYVYWQNNTFAAIFIAIYSLVFIGFVIDNVIKPLIINLVNKIVLERPIKINEMVVFISILAGLASFGFWGIIIGPTISAFFIALVRMYQSKFKDM